MKTTMATLAALALMASAALAQAITKDEIIKLSKEGVGEDVIIAKIKMDRPAFTLSADDILDLKKQGVSDKVIAMMIETKPADAKPQATLAKNSNVIAKNSSFVPMYVTVNETEKTFSVSLKTGAEMKVDGLAGWKLAPGTWTVAIDGHKTIDTFEVKEGGAVNLTFNGANTSYLELVTLIVEGGGERLVCIISSVGKLSQDQVKKKGFRQPGEYEGAIGTRYRVLPLISNRVLLGAGIGAIIGHQSGHRTEGAIIGAVAGLTLDMLGGWRRW